jgi:type IV pilus assembly protein PilP
MERLYKTNNFKGLKRSSIVLLSVGFLFFVADCGGETRPLSSPVTGESPKVEKKTVEPVQVAEKAEKKEPENKNEEGYTYNSSGRPDPFSPFFQLTRDRGPRGPVAPLQQYDLSQLRLVAIITIPEGNIALVEDSLGKGYFVRKGTLIGKNDGKVKQILTDMVTVEEVYGDFSGQKKFHEVSLFLYRSEKEGGAS